MLDNALDLGLKESEFWEMTVAELDRYVESKRRMQKLEQKEKATHNYIQALLIGRVVLKAFDSNMTIPEIHEVYPSLFTVDKAKEEVIQERKDELSALRFKQFAESFNQKFNEEEAKTINE